ncbi:MAG: T9SS type A sorting domain-containing protein [Bacteroidetes bacterium]|nr:T9SS type A sorting domain-containing protein [Bacteroidota bacterium]
MVTLDLTINQPTTGTFTTSACGSYTWVAKGNKVYTASNNTDSIIITNVAGCDSVVILNLTINTSTHNVTTQTACDSYVWNGRTYTASTVDTFSYTNSNGCASVDTLKLTINKSSSSIFTVSSCGSYTWALKNNKVYTASNNTDTVMLMNTAGCDSIVTLNLTINQPGTSTFTVTSCGSYTWVLKNNKVYTANNNTDTVLLVGAAANGCDSIITLNLSMLANIASIDIINSGAYCGDTAKTQLKTNISTVDFPGTTYAWTKQDFISSSWSFFSNDSAVNISDVYPTQYVVQVSIPGCGNFFSNQKMVIPINNPNISVTPSPAVSICNNNTVNFIAASADSGVNNYSFWKGASQVQNGAGLTYNTPNLTTADDGVVYTVQATNVKPVFDGNINENFWGKPLAVSVWGPSSGFGAGHELNAVYSRADANNIYLAVAGNVQNNNRIMVFIDSKTGGYNTGNYGRNGIGNNAIKNFNSGNVFDPGFEPDYCLGIGTDGGRSQFYFDLVEMKGNAATGTSVSNYAGSNLTPSVGYSIGANPANNTQTQGFEIAIPKTDLGYTNGDIRIFVMYSADNGFLSNQFLTKALISSGNYGSGVVNFGLAAPGHIAIPVASIASKNCITEVTTTVTVKANATSNKYDTVCNNMLPYVWAGKNYTMSGTYYDTTLGSNGCDSIATLNLTINMSTHNVTTQVTCDSLVWNGTTYTTSGIYTYSYNNSNGCASVDTLFLTINNGTHNTTTQTACDSLVWNGTTYTTSGTYTYSYNNSSGCASVDTLYLTINNGTHNTTTQTSCDSLVWNGTTYTTSGIYTYSYSNSNGCASVDTLYLTINNGTHNVTTQATCDSLVWNGTTYTTSGTYTYSYNNSNGCASVDTLHLTINSGTHNVVTTSSCDSMMWNGTTYYTSGTYTYSYNNSNGCASVDTLHLTINNSPAKPTIIASITAITAPTTGVVYTCSSVANAVSYTWSYTGAGATINNNGDTTITVDFAANATSGYIQVNAFIASGCTSANDTVFVTITPLPIVLSSFTADKVNKTSVLKWTSKTEVNSKLYEVQRSIDGRSYSTLGTVVAKGFASDYNFTDEKPFVGINYYRLKQVDKDGKFEYSAVRTVNFKPETNSFIVNIYPNPVSNVLNVRITNADAKQIRVFDMNGKTVYTTTAISSTGTTTIPVSNLSKATYFVEITTTDGRREVEQFIKE